MNNEPRFYAIDATSAYPEPVGTDDKLELNLEAGAVYVHLNYKRTKLVGLQSLDFLISQLALIREDIRAHQCKADFIRINSAAHCQECGHPDCNGQCYGDDMMGASG